MRVLEAESGWWALGPGGTALLPRSYVDHGTPTAEGDRWLVDNGVTIRRPTRHFALTVLTSTACNLGCAYCFQNTAPALPGRFDPPRIGRSVLDSATIGDILDFTRRQMDDGGLESLFIMLFGGEPLLNALGCKELLRRAQPDGLAGAAMISNGVLLRPALAIALAELGLRSVQITFDGPSEIHDSVRATRMGRPTFDRIIDNITAAQGATDLKFSFRINLTPAALAGSAALLDELASRVRTSGIVIDLCPVLDYGVGFDRLIDREDESVAAILATYGQALQVGFTIPRPKFAHCDFCSEQRGRTGAVVNADGTLVSCWETAGLPGYEVGSVRAGYSDYEPERWIACGTRATAAGVAQARISDRLDAAVLDLLHRRCEPCMRV